MTYYTARHTAKRRRKIKNANRQFLKATKSAPLARRQTTQQPAHMWASEMLIVSLEIHQPEHYLSPDYYYYSPPPLASSYLQQSELNSHTNNGEAQWMSPPPTPVITSHLLHDYLLFRQKGEHTAFYFNFKMVKWKVLFCFPFGFFLLFPPRRCENKQQQGKKRAAAHKFIVNFYISCACTSTHSRRAGGSIHTRDFQFLLIKKDCFSCNNVSDVLSLSAHVSLACVHE